MNNDKYWTALLIGGLIGLSLYYLNNRTKEISGDNREGFELQNREDEVEIGEDYNIEEEEREDTIIEKLDIKEKIEKLEEEISRLREENF